MFNERLLVRYEDLRQAERQALLEFQATVEADPRFSRSVHS